MDTPVFFDFVQKKFSTNIIHNNDFNTFPLNDSPPHPPLTTLFFNHWHFPQHLHLLFPHRVDNIDNRQVKQWFIIHPRQHNFWIWNQSLICYLTIKLSLNNPPHHFVNFYPKMTSFITLPILIIFPPLDSTTHTRQISPRVNKDNNFRSPFSTLETTF